MKNRISSHGKQVVYALLITVILLIITTAIYIIAYINNGGLIASSQIIVAVAVIGFGIIAVVVVYLKQLIKDKNVSKLNEQYIEAFEQIKDYFGLSPLGYIEKLELKDEILVLFLDAQQNNRTPAQIIGDDYTAFAENMIKAHGAKNGVLNDLLTGLQFYIVYIFLVTGLLLIEGNNFFKVKIDYTVLFFFAVASFVILPIAFAGKRKAISSNGKNSAYFLSVCTGVVVAVLFIVTMRVLRNNFINIVWIKEFLDGGTVIIKSPIHVIALLVGIPIIQLIKYSIRKM